VAAVAVGSGGFCVLVAVVWDTAVDGPENLDGVLVLVVILLLFLRRSPYYLVTELCVISVSNLIRSGEMPTYQVLHTEYYQKFAVFSEKIVFRPDSFHPLFLFALSLSLALLYFFWGLSLFFFFLLLFLGALRSTLRSTFWFFREWHLN